MIPMKRILTLLLAFAMILSLAACGAAPAENAPDSTTQAPATAPSDGPRLVTNVDEFLAAIAPGAEILMAEGTYYLNSATDFGNSSSPYYQWGGWDNESLILKADNLTIRGAGQGKTNLLTEPRTADVLSFEDSQNITLESMSLGHTVKPQPCDGGVVSLSSVTGATLKDLDLYGCGTVGISAGSCQSVHVQDCVVHDCSYYGVGLSGSKDVTIQSSTFRSLGKEEPVTCVFSIWECGNVEISNNVVTDNYVGNLLDVNSYADSTGENNSLTFRDNSVSGNRIAQAMFSVFDSAFCLDGNLFDENESRNWYATGSAHAVDLEGVEVVFEDDSAPEAAPAGTASAKAVSTGPQTEVRVKTVDEFLKALASDTCIILDAELFDLTTATEYDTAQKYMERSDWGDSLDGSTDSYYWEYAFEGPALVIEGLHNLTIKAEGDDRAAHTISATPRHADVLTFDNCSGITLSGFTAGHTKEPGVCSGGVVLFKNCEDMLVDNCGLFGCGIIGVQARDSRNLQIINSEIYECSQCGITLYNTENVTIAGTLIRDIHDDYFGDGPFFTFSGCSGITLDGESMDGNYTGR